MASKKMLGTWDPSALFLLLEEAGEAGLGPWTMKPFPSACPNCLVFAAESYRRHRDSQVIGKVTYCPLTNGRRRAPRVRGYPLSPAGNTFPAFWDP